jgi:16S rRNA (guanine1516-N2)-methyltransferase
VYDATAGLGRDAFLLALLGCEVYLMERHPTIATLLQTGIDHARQEPTLQPIIQRMHLIPGDARLLIPLLKTTYQPAHAIYLDPMFPTRKKSALVKKDMHALQMMVGADNDYDELLSLSLSEARTRVTVKRPIHAPPLGQKTPSFSVCGKCIRYDIYLTPR